MKICDRNLTGTGPNETGKITETPKPEPQNGTGAASVPADGGDRVELSGALNRLSRALSAFGGSRADRVQDLAAQYQSGNYGTDSAATSRSMVSEALAAGAQ